MTDGRRLIIFAKEPVAGRVKTRLIPALGSHGAMALYCELLQHSLESAMAVHGCSLELWIDHSDGDAPHCRALADRFGAKLHRQTGDDLGERMHRAFAADEMRPTVLIGSDCPGYSRAYLNAAFDRLERHRAVLGPALDGGYVLIGLRRTDPRLFDAMPWSTAAVLRLTRQRLSAMGWEHSELPPLSDLDTPDDLGACPTYAALRRRRGRWPIFPRDLVK